MNLDQLISAVSRSCFVGGFAFLVLVIIEELALSSGISILAKAYTPETLLTIGAVLFIVVITLILRQIREELKRRTIVEALAPRSWE